jgi:hypothetical protein
VPGGTEPRPNRVMRGLFKLSMIHFLRGRRGKGGNHDLSGVKIAVQQAGSYTIKGVATGLLRRTRWQAQDHERSTMTD